MTVEFHPAVQQDVKEALRSYQAVSGILSGEFKAELRRAINKAAENPNRFHSVKHGFHRANLRRFPYHFIYCEISDGIRVTLVRHNRRHPDLGMERK